MSSSGRKLIRRDELIGKDAYDFNARKVGMVTDVAFSEDAKPVLVVVKPDKTEEMVPLDSVDRLGDIVLLKAAGSPTTSAPPIRATVSSSSAPSNGRICIKCGAVNPLASKFCTQCRNQFY